MEGGKDKGRKRRRSRGRRGAEMRESDLNGKEGRQRQAGREGGV